MGGGEGGCRGPWALSVGAGCCSCMLGALVGAGHRSRAVGRCRLLWALGLLRVGSLLGVLSLLGVGSLLDALVVLGLSWDERGGVDVVTYRDVTTNDDFRSSFVVQLPRRCQRRGTCERGMSGGGLTSTRRRQLCPLVGCRGFEEPVLMGIVFGDGQ